MGCFELNANHSLLSKVRMKSLDPKVPSLHPSFIEIGSAVYAFLLQAIQASTNQQSDTDKNTSLAEVKIA